MEVNKPIDKPPLQSFYEQLSKSGRIQLPEYDSFERTLTQDPDQRRRFYDTISGNRLVRDLPDFESFERTLFLPQDSSSPDRSFVTEPGIFSEMIARQRPPRESARNAGVAPAPPILARAMEDADKSKRLSNDVTQAISQDEGVPVVDTGLTPQENLSDISNAEQFLRAMEIEGIYQELSELRQQLDAIPGDQFAATSTPGIRARVPSEFAEDRKNIQQKREELSDRVSSLLQVDIDLAEKMNRQRWAGWEVGSNLPDPQDRINDLQSERQVLRNQLLAPPRNQRPKDRAEAIARLAQVEEELKPLNNSINGTVGERIQHAGRMMVRGVSELPAGFLGSVAVMAKDLDDLFGGIDPKIGDKEAHELASAKAGQRIRDWAEETFPGDERMQEKFFSDFASAIGSFGSYIALGYLTRGIGGSGGTAAAVSAGGAGMDRAYQQVYEMTGDSELAQQAARWGVLPGLVQVANVVRILHKTDRVLGGKVHQATMNHLREAGLSGLNEAIVETIGDVGFNIIADTFTDEDVNLFENWMRTASVSGSAGALSGFVNNLALALISKGRMSAPTPSTPRLTRAEQPGQDIEDVGQAPDTPASPPIQDPQTPTPRPPDIPETTQADAPQTEGLARQQDLGDTPLSDSEGTPDSEQQPMPQDQGTTAPRQPDSSEAPSSSQILNITTPEQFSDALENQINTELEKEISEPSNRNEDLKSVILTKIEQDLFNNLYQAMLQEGEQQGLSIAEITELFNTLKDNTDVNAVIDRVLRGRQDTPLSDSEGTPEPQPRPQEPSTPASRPPENPDAPPIEPSQPEGATAEQDQEATPLSDSEVAAEGIKLPPGFQLVKDTPLAGGFGLYDQGRLLYANDLPSVKKFIEDAVPEGTLNILNPTPKTLRDNLNNFTIEQIVSILEQNDPNGEYSEWLTELNEAGARSNNELIRTMPKVYREARENLERVIDDFVDTFGETGRIEFGDRGTSIRIKADGPVSYGIGTKISNETPGDQAALERVRPEQPDQGTYESIPKSPGREIAIAFTPNERITGRYAVIEARDLKPSHLRDGSRNPQHKISMAQPRDRSDADIRHQPELIARNLNPDLITGNHTAFHGAPVATPDGQAIQGNGRMLAMIMAYAEYNDQVDSYKQHLVDNADAYGLSSSAIEQMEQPVLVRELDVPTKEAVRLGNIQNQFEAKTNRTDLAKATIRNLPQAAKENIAAMLSNSSGDTLMEMIDDVGVEILGQFRGLDRTGLLKDGKLTQDGKDLIRETFVGLVFDSEVNPDAIKYFRRIPHLIRAGIERSMGSIVSFTGTDADFGPVLQKAVEIVDSIDQSEGSIKDVPQFMREGTVFDGRNADRFTTAEAAMADFFLKAKNQREIRNLFRQIEKTIHGETTLFEEIPGTGVSAQGLQEALAQTLGTAPPPGPGPAGTELGPEGRGRGTVGKTPRGEEGTEVERADGATEGSERTTLADPSGEKQTWEMTPEEFKRFVYTPIVEGIKESITRGARVSVRTALRVTPLESPEHIRITRSGQVQIPERRGKWASLTTDQIYDLANQAGLETPTLADRPNQLNEIGKAIKLGDPVPPENIRRYEESREKREDSSQYAYHLVYRPFDIGTYPQENFVRHQDDGSRYGVVIYSQPLSIAQQQQFELEPVTELEPYDGSQVLYYEDYRANITLEPSRTGVMTVKMEKLDQEGQPIETETLSGTDFLSGITSGQYRPVTRKKTTQKKPNNEQRPEEQEKGADTGRSNRPKSPARPPTGTTSRDRSSGYQKPAPGSPSEWGRPGLVYTTDAKNIPMPKEHVGEGEFAAIDDHQRFGVNMILDRFEKGGEGFLLADGTGAGKTMQILAAASRLQESGKGNVLVITQNQQIIDNNFAADAALMGVDLSTIEMGTYTQMADKKVGRRKYYAVIFDEAHNLKNQESKRSIAARKIEAKHRVFVTATPFDTVNGAVYFVTSVTNMTEPEVYSALGLVQKVITDKDGNVISETYHLDKGVSPNDIPGRINALRDRIINDGGMIRRELPYYGQVQEINIEQSSEGRQAEEVIDDYWETRVDEERNENGFIPLNKLKNLMGQRSGELSRANEIDKIDEVESRILADIEAGRSVVVIAEGINPTEIKALGEVIPGFHHEMMKRLDAHGIKYAKVFGQGDKSNEVAKFQGGKVDVVLATPQSGGTGVNLDDTIGTRPRTLYMVTANYSGNQFDQILGRVSRRNTRTPAETNILYNTGLSDSRRRQIVTQKIQTLNAIQQGLDVGEEGFNTDSIAPPAVDVDVSNYNANLKGTNVTAEAYGSTVIFKGDTKPVKHRLKAIKARWHGKQKGWMIPAQNTNQIKQAIDAIRDEKGFAPIYGVAGPSGEASRAIIGKLGATYLDYVEDVSTRLDNLQLAREMERGKSVTPMKIFQATGWERGADGKWRYELADLSIKDQYWDNHFNKIKDSLPYGTNLGDIAEGQLLDAYPDLKEVGLVIVPMQDESGAQGHFDPNKNEIVLKYHVNGIYQDGQFLSTLVHEVQHAIQLIEGFARGGSPESALQQVAFAKKAIHDRINSIQQKMREVSNRDAPDEESRKQKLEELEILADEEHEIRKGLIDLQQKSQRNKFATYFHLAGETEARNAEKRADMTPEARHQKMMKETEDVSRKDQIVIMRGLDMHASEPSLHKGMLPRDPIRRTQYSNQNYESLSTDIPDVQVRFDKDGMYAVSNDTEIHPILGLLGGVYNEQTGEFYFSKQKLERINREDISEQIQGFLQMREDGFRSITRGADIGAPKRKASYMAEAPVTARGKKFYRQIKRDKGGQSIGMRTIVDYLNEVVLAEMRVGKSQTTKRNPAHYKPMYHIVRTRISDWVLNFHEAGHALSAILSDKNKNWWSGIKKDLKAITETIGVHASAKTAEEGFAEWVRLYITNPTALPPGVTRSIETYLKQNHPKIFHGLQDAGRMYVAHAERSPTARFLSGRYDKGIKKPLKDRLRDNREHFAFYYGSVEQATDMVIDRVFRSMYREDQNLARQWRDSLKGTPSDIQSAWHQMYQIKTEVKRAIHGSPSGEGLRIMAQASRRGDSVNPEIDIAGMHELSLERDPRLKKFTDMMFREKSVDNIIDLMKAVGFSIPSSNTRHGEYMSLSDKSIDSIKKEVGFDNWQDFTVYGHFRTLLYRYNMFGHAYQGMRDTLPPSVLKSEVKRLENAYPVFKNAYKNIQHFFDQLLLVSVFSGEKSPIEAVRIVREHDDYWPLNKVLDTPKTGVAFSKGDIDSGIREAKGSEHALSDFDSVIEAKVNTFLEVYYNNRYQNSLLNFINDILLSDKYSLEVKAVAGRVMTPLRLDTKKVATINQKEGREIIAEYLNEQLEDTIQEEMRQAAMDPDNPDPAPGEWAGGFTADDISLNWSGKPIYRSTRPRAINVVAPFVNGQRRYYQISDQILFDAITRSQNIGESLKFLYDVLYPMTEAVKQPISHSFTFGLRQLVGRNIPQQVLFANHKRQLIPAFNTGVGVVNRLTGREQAAIDQAHLLSMAFNKVTTKEHYTRWQNFLEVLGEGIVYDDYFQVSNMEKAKRFPGQFTRAMMKPISMTQYLMGLRTASVWMESTPREGAFVVEKIKGYNTEVAQRAAAIETGYFASYPGSPAAHVLYRIIMYMNPGIQSNYQEARRLLFEPDPQKRAQAWAVKLPTIIAYNAVLNAMVLGAIGLMADDPEEIYAELRDRTVTDKIHFKYFNKNFKIPFGYGISGAAESVGWNMMESYLLENPLETQDRIKMVLGRMRDYPGGYTDFFPPHFRGAIELQSNYQFFFGEHIVPPFLESQYPYNPELQYYHTTPEIYRRGGDILGVSPLKVQYAARLVMSNTMDQIITTADRLIAGDPISAADLPDIGGLFRRQAVDGQSRAVRTIREMATTYESLNKKLSALEAQGISEEQYELIHRQLLEFHSAKAVHDHIRGIRRSMNDLRNENRRLNNEQPERYRTMIRTNNETIEALQRELTELAREYLPIIREEQSSSQTSD